MTSCDGREMRHSVLIVQRRMTEYRVPLFERLRRLLADRDVTLQVVQGTSAPSELSRGDMADLDWATSCKCAYLPLARSRPYRQHVPKALVDCQDLVILPHENWMMANNPWLLLRKPKDRLLAFWGHGANFQASRPGRGLERLKPMTARRADWWFAYTSLSVERLRALGFPGERVTCLDNAVDTTQLSLYREQISDDELETLRQRLGITGQNTAIFIGSLHKQKRMDLLLKAADRLRQQLTDFELVIVGDGPLRRAIEAQASSRDWVKVVGPRRGRDKVLYAALGKVMLNPGMVGLGILDSFALGIPMVTTDCHLHSPEIAYLRPEMNGVMTPDHLDAYVARVASLLPDTAALTRLANGCREDASRYTVDKMAHHFAEGIELALGSHS